MGPTETAVKSASAARMVTEGAKLGTSTPHWNFLSGGRPFESNNDITYFEGLLNQPSAISAQDEIHAAEYLALSQSAHYLDSWRYLASASYAYLSSATEQCLHLSYYAELRAAMSLLAGSGICILKKHHFAQDSTGHLIPFKGATHEQTWVALEKWSEEPATFTDLSSSITLLGVPLADWATAAGTTYLAPALTQAWIRNWAFDLSCLSQDRDLRNIASYRPNLASTKFRPASSADIDVFLNVARSCEEGGTGPFHDLDTALCHDLLETLHNMSGLGSTTTPVSYNDFLDRTARGLVVNGIKNKQEANSLLASIKSATTTWGWKVIQAADPSDHSACAVYCRAILLCRLTSFTVSQRWQDMTRIAAGGRISWNTNLLQSFAKHALILDPSNNLSLPQIIEDQIIANEDIAEWKNLNPAGSGFKYWQEIGHRLIDFCRSERAGLLALKT